MTVTIKKRTGKNKSMSEVPLCIVKMTESAFYGAE
jgi:hypothetical protein